MHHARIKLGITIVIGIAFAMYVLFQARFFIVGPTLTILEPTTTHYATSTLLVRGSVTHAVEITVNDFPIDTDRAGNFSYELVIPEGYSILTVTARDRYGRTKSIARELFLESESHHGIQEKSGS
jgi:hypothetical protein